ncbi:mitochondrial ATP synthase g subunit-domain-containing protein [Zopfochytrium polystomum]|nr:mitochondrial ATP synthase g subunit-domain-containing protein [Zopfochytrium polystomum]
MNRLAPTAAARFRIAAVPSPIGLAAARRFATTDSAKAATNGLASRITAITEPVIYYTKVSAEFAKLVFTHGKVTIPNPAHMAEAQLGFSNFYTAFTNGAWKKVTVAQAGQLAAAGVTVYGFFLVGEMIGRGSIIGYDVPGSGHAGGHH